MSEETRRIGRFEIDRSLIHYTPKAALAILAGCIVVRAEDMFCYSSVEYIALADHFEPISNSQMVPWYDVNIRDLVGGKYHVTFTRSERR